MLTSDLPWNQRLLVKSALTG